MLPAAPDPPILPDPDAPGLTRMVEGRDQTGARLALPVVEERPLTIWLNNREIVTAMTIGDRPEWLAVGFLRNQGMLRGATLTAVQFDAETESVIVRTAEPTEAEARMSRRIRTSGCAVGTVFGDMMGAIEGLRLPPARLRTSWLYALSRQINMMPSLYLSAGAIHGTVLCREDKALIYCEDVGRHNAVDKIAGWMTLRGEAGADKILYTTGRLTSEMVVKCAAMGVPVLASRSGFTAFGVDLAREVGLTLIGRLRGRRFVCLSGAERIEWDADPEAQPDEPARAGRKGAR